MRMNKSFCSEVPVLILIYFAFAAPFW